FFQAEDGIRDRNVTGVQTCALPISWGHQMVGGRSTWRRGGVMRVVSVGGRLLGHWSGQRHSHYASTPNSAVIAVADRAGVESGHNHTMHPKSMASSRVSGS